MGFQPRLALATPASGPEPSPASLAWLAGLTDRRWRVQHFRSRACPFGTEAVGQVTGLPGRHLDAWLMPDDVCRRLFLRGARQADLCLVEGTLEEPTAPLESAQHDRPGGLAPIAEALDLPVVALVSCLPLDQFHLPHLPAGVDAVLLDGLENPDDYEAYRNLVTLMARKPVLGAVEALPEVRAAIRQSPRDQPLDDDLFRKLGASFLRFADLGAIRNLAQSRPFPSVSAEPEPLPYRRFRVAYAQDEAFGSYFPDTLEALEALGAELVEFSPLRDESLPEAIDLVMIGCGFPDRHADALTENLSLIAALRSHVCRGQRIYSEGGGTAYLGRTMILGDRRVPGAGILPFDAEVRAIPRLPMPVTRTLTRDGWLGPKGTTVRGYKSGRWRLLPGADPLDCPSCFGTLTTQGDISYHHHAIGSLVHLHLGALPEVVAAFAGPHRASLTLPFARP
ncbi:cobyrinic acid a,c-diamide synthase [Singulisphaera sp. GP187]|uniref:cobyrinic acid a,c-diamide synthase n=1 Tax=Singulisphaera sp. GP187 TaxID=1882752 RepID=UPI00092A0C24|nr:cobyrinic acid a,c-diamide synthase [Singulisphaera sp. GP187]SIO16263.1 cobyrinic acid a,c-diamide synthase [Singulisphaera sp. GP187]